MILRMIRENGETILEMEAAIRVEAYSCRKYNTKCRRLIYPLARMAVASIQFTLFISGAIDRQRWQKIGRCLFLMNTFFMSTSQRNHMTAVLFYFRFILIHHIYD